MTIKQNNIRLPDPQIIEMEALDNAFYDWVSNINSEDWDDVNIDYYQEEWAAIDRNALVFTSSDMEPLDAYDDYMGGSVEELAMERNMAERIEQKRRMIARINSDF